MTKKEAVEFLGVSESTLERYVSKGMITVTYVQGKTGRVGDYDEAELTRFKEERENVVVVPQGASSREGASGESAPSSTLAVPESSVVLPLAVSDTSGPSSTLKPLTVAVLPRKLLYTLEEAEQATSVSKARLRAAIVAGELKAGKVGRSYRVRPAALREWVEKTF